MNFKLINSDPTWPQYLINLIDHPARWNLANKMRSWDESLYRHGLNTAAYSYGAGKCLGINDEYLEYLVLGAFFHDYAKADWPKCLLDKELDQSDRITIHAHPTIGAQKVAEEWPDVPDVVLRIIREHHERQDGTGYPSARRNGEIHSLSLIVATIEVYVALQEPRSYRKRCFTREEALSEIAVQFTGEVVELLSEGILLCG